MRPGSPGVAAIAVELVHGLGVVIVRVGIAGDGIAGGPGRSPAGGQADQFGVAVGPRRSRSPSRVAGRMPGASSGPTGGRSISSGNGLARRNSWRGPGAQAAVGSPTASRDSKTILLYTSASLVRKYMPV